MGMFSAGKQRCKHASIDFLRARMRARKNGVVPYMDHLFKDERERIVNWAVGQGKIGRQVKRNRLSLGRSSLGMQR